MVGWLAQVPNCLRNLVQTSLQYQPLPPMPHCHYRAAKQFCLGGYPKFQGGRCAGWARATGVKFHQETSKLRGSRPMMGLRPKSTSVGQRPAGALDEC
eukprot:1158449-Pelagomonas_calceolata.AAC.9